VHGLRHPLSHPRRSGAGQVPGLRALNLGRVRPDRRNDRPAREAAVGVVPAPRADHGAGRAQLRDPRGCDRRDAVPASCHESGRRGHRRTSGSGRRRPFSRRVRQLPMRYGPGNMVVIPASRVRSATQGPRHSGPSLLADSEDRRARPSTACCRTFSALSRDRTHRLCDGDRPDAEILAIGPGYSRG